MIKIIEVLKKKIIQENLDEQIYLILENWLKELNDGKDVNQNEKIEATYHVHLKRDGTIDGIKLTYYFCGVDLNNECEHFILNMKNTILRTFPIKDLLSMDYKYWYCLWLPGSSKEANELFLEQQTKK